jgi:5-methylcytosine-specific restriction endonuclease McrA
MKILKCCHCKDDFLEENFYRDKSRPSGRKPRCKKCEKEYLNRENRRKYEANYRKEKPDKRQKIMRTYYENNKESHNETKKKYRLTDQFKANHRHHSALRRARILNNGTEKIDFIDVYKTDPKCFYCGIPLLFNDVEFDHYIPIAKGGSHTKNNLRVSCAPCNRRKGAMSYQMV